MREDVKAGWKARGCYQKAPVGARSAQNQADISSQGFESPRARVKSVNSSIKIAPFNFGFLYNLIMS
jgi:hypothetical protein